VDADGKKVLFVEEVQSDWHQAGRKKGYINPSIKQKIDDEINSIDNQMSEMAKVRDPVTDQMIDEKGWFELAKKRDALKKQQIGAVPDAPFKTSWHELALKRAIQLASEGGYDRIAFTTGKTQAERYDLSKQISELRLSKNGELKARTSQNPAIFTSIASNVTPDNLADYVGKDVAAKLLDATPNDIGARNLKGVDLQVGGEGMKGFYDTILPKYLDKYGKKWDAKTGMTNIRLATDKQDMADSELLGELGLPKGGKAMASVHYMDITPKMKESVLTKGQPLFQMAPAIPAGVAAGQQEDNK
jgi:hypothetical protein